MGLFDQHAPRKAEVLPPAKEQELIFHDSIPIEEEKLPQARDKAAKQKELVLSYFRDRFSMNFTPVEMHQIMTDHEEKILLNSVRRSISDLTKGEKLIKCPWDERRMGIYGKDNRTWRYNAEFINRLNPQKHIDIRDMHKHPDQQFYP